MTTTPNGADEVLDPNAADPEAEREANSNDVRADMAPQTIVNVNVPERRNPYDVAVPETLRERLAYARMLAQAGMLPKDYRQNPANVLVAGELGRELGLTVVQSVLLLDVVEGRPSLGAKGVRATVQRAGHYMSAAHIFYNKHGQPVEASVTGRRSDTDQEETITWSIDRAVRAGLCSVTRDDDGEVTVIRARSQYDKVLPWEAHTEDMLDARATVKLGRILFGDVTMGLSYTSEELRETPPAVAAQMREAVGKPAVAPTERAQAVLQQVKPARRTDLPDEYEPEVDLALFADVDGGWWNDAGAQVSRRNTRQLAADRLAKWVADNPDQNVVPLPPVEPTPNPDGQGDEPVVTEVCGYPACVLDQHDTGDHVDANGDVLVPEPDDLPPSDPEPADDEPRAEPWGGDSEPDDQEPVDTVADAGPDLDPVPDDEPTADASPLQVTAADLLAEIDAAGVEVGKSRQALMVRWIATHRKNPEDATADELLPFVEQLRVTLAARRG